MPIISDLSITSVSYNTTTYIITINGVAFSENQYDGKVEVSVNGGAYSEPSGSYSWSDTQVVLTLDSKLTDGTYAVRLVNGDGETSEALAKAIVVGGIPRAFWFNRRAWRF